MAELITFMLQGNGFLDRLIIFAPFSIRLSETERRNAESLLPPNKDLDTLYDQLNEWKPEPSPLFYFDEAAAL